MSMGPDENTEAAIEANRKRYEELKAAAHRKVTKGLPGPTGLHESALEPGAVLHRETIPGGWYWTAELKRGHAIRIVNGSGLSSVSLLAWNSRDPSERLNHADTVKVQWSAKIRKGRMILSDMGRAILSVIEDTSFAHDALMGGSTAASTEAKFGKTSLRNTRDNFVLAAGKLGLDRRDIPPCITFFAPVSVNGEGSFVWNENERKAGDFVDLRAEIDLFIALSNCPHPLDPSADYASADVEAIIFKALPASAEDLTRTATEEAVRAFENTDAVTLFERHEAGMRGDAR